MNILVTGANGQLGNEMRIVAEKECYAGGGFSDNRSAWRFLFSDIVGSDNIPKGENVSDTCVTYCLDITDANAVKAFVAEHKIDCIVNCAAYTNVDAAEDNESVAEMLNASAVGNLATAMHEVGGLLVHISTDYVFGGNVCNTPCGEDQPENPTGVYGITKLHGEQAVKSIGGNYVIIRTAWLYSEFGKNFVKTMLDLISSRPELKVVFDQVGTPTYALDLAEAVMVVLDDYAGYVMKGNMLGYSKKGVYHYSNEGVCSWYDFAKMIAEIAGNTDCNIMPCHSREFPSKVVRPSYSVLDKTKIKNTFGVNVPYWTESLRKCLERLKNQL